MAVWDELKVILVRLRNEQPGALMSYPMPDVDEGRQPPFIIRLAPWAAAAAEDLYQRFGDDVTLTLGPFPILHAAGRSALPCLAGPPSCSTHVRWGLAWTVKPH